MEKQEFRILEGRVDLPYRWSLGPVFSRFFDELKNKKIMGSKCPGCKRVLVPARKFCPRCFVDHLDWVQVGNTGTVKTWSLITFEFPGQPLPPPWISALIDLEGADTALAHFLGDIDCSDPEKVRDQVRIGMKVEAHWRENRQGTILDIAYFKPL